MQAPMRGRCMHSRRRPEKSSGRSPAAARSSMHRRFSTDSSTGVPVIGTARPESGTTKCSRLPPVPGRRTKKATGRAGSRLATGRAAHEGRRPLSVIFYQGTSAGFWQMPPPDRERLLRRFGVLYQGSALWSSMTWRKRWRCRCRSTPPPARKDQSLAGRNAAAWSRANAAKVRGGLPVRSATTLVIVSVGPPARWYAAIASRLSTSHAGWPARVRRARASSPEPRAGPLLGDAPQPLRDLRIACPRPHAAWLRIVGRDCDGDVAVLAVHAAAIVELSRSRAPHARRCAFGDRFEAGGHLARGFDRCPHLVRRQGFRKPGFDDCAWMNREGADAGRRAARIEGQREQRVCRLRLPVCDPFVVWPADEVRIFEIDPAARVSARGQGYDARLARRRAPATSAP